MPNWCHNILKITGDEDRLDQFDEAFHGFEVQWDNKFANPVSSEKFYSLNALYPIPSEVLAIGYSLQNVESLGKPASNSCVDGYNWCIDHWGTKWDLDTVDVENNGDERIYYFETAWLPILPWTQKVALDWPDLTFELRYSEPGMCFAGVLTITNDQISDVYFDGDEYLARYPREDYQEEA